MLKLCVKSYYCKKDRLSSGGRFPRKGGGSLGSLKYQAFPSQILSLNTFTNLPISNSLRAQSRMKTLFYARKQNAKQLIKNTIGKLTKKL